MTRLRHLPVCLLASAALFCAGCELPHGPLRWQPVHLDLMKHSPFHVSEEIVGQAAECADEPQQLPPDESGHAAAGPRLTHHHTAVPLAGPGLNAPWPKFHPVPTRPVFEPRCLPPQEMPVDY